jgi:hypothetical protein
MIFEDVASAKRVLLSALLVYVLWLLGHSAFAFAFQLKRQHDQHQQIMETLEHDGQREIAMLRENNENLARQRQQVATQLQTTPATKSARPKMPAAAVVKRLRQVNAFGVLARRERLLHCTDNRGAWDYLCVFHGDPMNGTSWVQFGVLVDKAHIIEMSETYPFPAPLPPPLTSASW